MSTKEEYIARCIAHGDDRRSAENTWELMEKIAHILKDGDIDPYQPPEALPPHKVRLARLFIEEYKARTLEADKVIARWIHEENDGRSAHTVAEAIAHGEHWKWWHTVSVMSGITLDKS